MKIVLDTNCLINIIFPRSNYRNVWQSFKYGEYTLCVSNEIIEEYREIGLKRAQAYKDELVTGI